jgi:hypothetical protein
MDVGCGLLVGGQQRAKYFVAVLAGLLCGLELVVRDGLLVNPRHAIVLMAAFDRGTE